MSPRISYLNIESVQAKHRGNYTCVAMNIAGRADLSSELHIDGRPAKRHFSYFFHFPKKSLHRTVKKVKILEIVF